MEPESEKLERAQLEALSTHELIRRALEESRLLVRTELLHARREMKEQLDALRTAAILMGSAALLALIALTALLLTVGLALPLAPWLGVLLVGLVLTLLAAGLGFLGSRRLPREPLGHTQERLKSDWEHTREVLQ